MSMTMVEVDPKSPRLTEELAAGLAHEVRNRLNSLQIHIGILEQELAELASGPSLTVRAQLRRVTHVLGPAS